MTEATKPGRLVFLDVDTQADFMFPSGKLYVPHAEEIIPNLAKLMWWARVHRIPVISSADAHAPDDPEFALWPPHCVVGTAGQRGIAETRFPDAVVVENRAGAFHAPPEWVGQFIIEKPVYAVSANVNFDSILASLGRARFVAFGVATEYCVLSDVMALRKHNLPVTLVSDAIKPITQEGGRKALQEMAGAGVHLLTAAEVCTAAFEDIAR